MTISFPEYIQTLSGGAVRRVDGSGYDVIDQYGLVVCSLSLKEALIAGEESKIFCAQCADIMSRQDWDDIARAEARINEIERYFLDKEQAA